MENIIFLILIIGSYIVRFLIKKSKEKEQQSTTVSSQYSPKSSNEELSAFDVVLKQFSQKIGRELNAESLVQKVAPVPEKVRASQEQVFIDEPIVEKVQKRSSNYRLKKKKRSSVVKQLRANKYLQDAVVASEVLQTKF